MEGHGAGEGYEDTAHLWPNLAGLTEKVKILGQLIKKDTETIVHKWA